MAKAPPTFHVIDFWPKWRDIRRNILIEEQLKSSLEQEELAKKEHLENQAFRAQQNELETQRLAYEKERLDLMAKEQRAQDLSRACCNRIFDAGLKLKAYDETTGIAQKFLILEEVDDLVAAIDRNTVLDLEFRDRLVEITKLLDEKEMQFAQENEALMPMFQKYEQLKLNVLQSKKVEQVRNFNDARTFKEFCADAAEVSNAVEGLPLDTADVEAKIQDFYKRISLFGAFWNPLIENFSGVVFDFISEKLLEHLALEKSILQDEEIGSIELVEPQAEDWLQLYKGIYEDLKAQVRAQKILIPQAQKLVNFLAKRSGKRPVSVRKSLKPKNEINVEGKNDISNTEVFISCTVYLLIAIGIVWGLYALFPQFILGIVGLIVFFGIVAFLWKLITA